MRIGWSLPLERLSATSMGLMIQCPEQFRQKYLLDVKETSNSGRFIGSVDHRVYARLATMPEGTDPEQVYREVWDEVLDADGEPDWRDDDPVSMFERGVKMVKLYQEEVGQHIKPVAIESRFEVKVPGVPAKIIGYIDLMEENLIRERKTTAVKQTKPKPKWRFQGMIYQYATDGMPLQWDVITRQVTPKIYTAADSPDLYLEPRKPQAIEDLIRDTAWRMNDLYQRHGRDEPWPTTGIFGDWLCDYCPIGPRYQGSCPQWTT